MFIFLLLVLLSSAATGVGQDAALTTETAKIETTYEADKDRTIVRLVAVQISGEQGKYKSLHMSPFFSFAGKKLLAAPEIIDFELRTVVNVKLLSTDLYVVFVIDGEQVFLSSNRWAVKRPVPGRVWVGEHLVFRMPYETYVRITKAKTFSLKFDGVVFPVNESHLQMLRDFLKEMQVENQATFIHPEALGR